MHGRHGIAALLAAASAALAPAASPAAAAPHHVSQKVAAGVALAGDTLVWGERGADGSLALVQRAPGAHAKVFKRIPAGRKRGEIVEFTGLPGAISASPTRIAFGLEAGTQRCQGDACSVQVTARTFVSRTGGPFADAFPGCAHPLISTDVDGDTVAVAQSQGSCGETPPTASVWLQDGDAPAHVIARPSAPDAFLGAVHIVGPYVAWSDGRGGDLRHITVADRATGAVVATLESQDLGGSSIERFDLDAEGHVAAIVRSGARSSAVVLSLRDRALRVLSRNALGIPIAIAGGRVALVTAHGYSARRLVLVDLDGTVLRTLMRFRRRDLQPTVAQDIALTATRVAWSFVRSPTGDPTQEGAGGVRSVALP